MSRLVDKLRQEVSGVTFNYGGLHRTVAGGWVKHGAGTRVGSCATCLEKFLKDHPEELFGSAERV